MQKVSFKLDPAFNGAAELPATLFVAGKMVSILSTSPVLLEVALPLGMDVDTLAHGLEVMLGVVVNVLVKQNTKVKGPDASFSDIASGMDRLVAHSVADITLVQQVPEPKLAINLADPSIDALIPVGKKIWDSVFAKRSPVLDGAAWALTMEADNYVYIPNDLSRAEGCTEEFVSNALYTQVLVNAYKLMCQREDINPSVRLWDDTLLQCRTMKPSAGSQHTVLEAVSGRLANSTLQGFDDSKYASSFIQCICDLAPGQVEREPVRKRVLAKSEFILMGRTSHTYNQRFVHALYAVFVTGEEDVPWQPHRPRVAETVMGILTQMVIEGAVLEDSKDIFLARTAKAGFGQYKNDFARIYEDARGGYYAA